MVAVTLSLRPGGRSEAIRHLARALTLRGWCTALVCLDELGCATPLSDVFTRVLDLRRNGLTDRRALTALKQFFLDFRPQIVHAHDAASMALCALALPAFSDCQLVTTFHRSLDFETATLRGRLRNALALLRFSYVITTSQERRNFFLSTNWLPARKVTVIPHGIPVSVSGRAAELRQHYRKLLGVDDGAIVLGAVGHYRREKGLDVVIDAYGRLRTLLPDRDIVLAILGTGTPEDEARLRTIARAAGGRTLFLGHQEGATDWMHAFDLFAHGARMEAFGLVLVEAMSAELPIVATASGGARDIVNDGVTGIIVPMEDAGQMAMSIADLIEHPERRAAMGTEAFRRAQVRFSLEPFAAAHDALFQSLLTSVQRRGRSPEARAR